MKGQIKFPRRGWAELRVRPTESGALAAITDIPGVNVWESEEGCDLHWSTWTLPSVELALVQTLGSIPLELVSHRPVESSFVEGKWRTKLHPWQDEAVRKALATGRLLLADDMGLGKTRVAATAANEHQIAHGRPVVVVGPNYARAVWASELVKARILASEDDLCVIRSRDMDHPSYQRNARWFFIHYDIVHAWSTHFATLAHEDRPCAVILDEAHWIKQGNALRSKGASRVAQLASMRILLTGTPMDNRPAELWHLLYTLEGKYAFGTAMQFRKRYCGAVRNNYGLVDGDPTHTEELRQRIEPIYLRRTVADIDPTLLPPLTRRAVMSELTEVQRQHHGDLLELPLTELLDALLTGRAGMQTIRLIDRLRKLTSRAKMSTTEMLVRDLLARGQSTIVFGWQRNTVCELAEKLKGFLVEGSFTQGARDEIVQDFQAKKEPAVLVATYGTLREGVTLTKATNVVLHDLDWKPSTMLQAEKRIHRLTQDRPCVSHWGCCENSIDTLLAKVFVRKAEYIKATLGISEPTEALDEVNIRSTLPLEFDPSEWVRSTPIRLS